MRLSGTLTRAKNIDAVAESNGHTRKKSIETALRLIKRSLESGEDVLISGFGKFSVKQKAKRKGRNPATGQDMILEPRKVVTLKCSGKLREKINGLKGFKSYNQSILQPLSFQVGIESADFILIHINNFSTGENMNKKCSIAARSLFFAVIINRKEIQNANL